MEHTLKPLLNTAITCQGVLIRGIGMGRGYGWCHSEYEY